MQLGLRLKCDLDDNISDLLNRIAKELHHSFTNLISNVSEQYKNNLDWWVEKPVSRNTLVSPLFYRFCCLHLINELIQTGVTIDKVIVDSAALFRAIDETKKKEGLDFELEGPDGALPKFHYYLWKSLKPFIEVWKRKRTQFRAAKKTKHLSSKPPKIGLTLIDQFVFPGFITKERYYNGLWETLSAEQKEKTLFVPTLVMMNEKDFEAAYRELRTCDRNFLIKEDYLTFSDLLFGLLHLIRVWFIKPKPKQVLGVDFSPFIREELLSEGVYDSALEGLLNYRFAQRLKEKSFDLSLIIDWWEGQPLDKGWNLGFNTFFMETSKKGYLGYAPRLMELQLYPSDSEIENNVAPSRIVTIGKAIKDEMKQINPRAKFDYAPSFRFNHLWDDPVITDSDNSSFTILVALTIIFEESIGIINKVAQSKTKLNIENVSFVIQPHPVIRIESIKNSPEVNWLEEFVVEKSSTNGDIRESDLLITGMSTIGLESIVLGIPTIIVKNNRGLFYDPIPDSVPKQLWRSCRSPEEISEAINYFKNRGPEKIRQHQELSAQIKKEYFEPVTKEGVYRFLELEV